MAYFSIFKIKGVNFKTMGKTSKPLLPVAIIIASIILGGFFYAIQVNKQRSIEKQQQIKIREDRRIEEAKSEQIQKEYVVKRKDDCYKIYLQEKENWNNVLDFYYSEIRDVCIIRYKSSEPAKPEEECNEIVKGIWELKNESLRERTWDIYRDCADNTFSKEF